jgi:hypothetical protein
MTGLGKLLAGVALAAGMAAAAQAQAGPKATTITGSIMFNTNPNNYFDPANGYVPSGYANDSGATVKLGSGATFAFYNYPELWTAAFTPTSLAITDDFSALIGLDTNNTQTFTASTPGFFDDISLTSNSLGVGYKVSNGGDTLMVTWAGGQLKEGLHSADFTFSGGAPEPATWAMLVLGLGLIGLAARARRDGATLAA